MPSAGDCCYVSALKAKTGGGTTHTTSLFVDGGQPDAVRDGRAGGRESPQVHLQRERRYRGNGAAICHSDRPTLVVSRGRLGKTNRRAETQTETPLREGPDPPPQRRLRPLTL